MYRSFNRGIQFLKLRPEPLSNSVRRVTAFLNDIHVGELSADDARYFHTEVSRLNDFGFELFLECKVTSSSKGRSIVYRHINRAGLMMWVREKLKSVSDSASGDVNEDVNAIGS